MLDRCLCARCEINEGNCALQAAWRGVVAGTRAGIPPVNMRAFPSSFALLEPSAPPPLPS